MSNDTTNKLCEILEKKAVSQLRENLLQQTNTYRKCVGLQGRSETILIETNANMVTPIPRQEGERVDTVEIRINSTELLEAIVSTLTRLRTRKAEADAIVSFMANVDSFRDQVMALEQYIEQNEL